MEAIKAEMVDILTAKQIHEIAIKTLVAQQNINASNSVISNDNLPIIARLSCQKGLNGSI